jgi:hypothetical protein
MKHIKTESYHLYKKANDYFYRTLGEIPFGNDIMIIRNATSADSTMVDTIILPDIFSEDDAKVFVGQCASYRSENHCLVPGMYDYRLAKMYGAVFGMQVGPVFVHDGTKGMTDGDHFSQKLAGMNILFNPIHRFLKPGTPISKCSPGSITVERNIYPTVFRNWENNACRFRLFIGHSHEF